MTDYLATMAVMKVNYDRRGHDVLEMLVPFVADCARESPDPLSDLSIQGELQDRFGLPVPRTVIKTLLRRLTRRGILVRERGVFVAVRPNIDAAEFDLSASLSEVRLAQRELLRAGTEFAHRVFGQVVNEDDLSKALSVICRQQIVPLAVWAVRGAPVVLPEEPTEVSEQISAKFILHVISEGSARSQTALIQIARGGLLSGVLWSSDMETPDRRIEDLEFFLDTTLLLRLLGLCGEARKSFSEELVHLANQSGIKLFCFEHNRREIVGVLSAALDVVRSRRSRYFGEAVEYMVSEGWQASDVEEVIANLDEKLAENGVEVRRAPLREARYNMDETQLRTMLDQSVKYLNPVALDADVDSLAGIFTLRRARQNDRLELSRAVFVTTNYNLARGARQLYKIGEDELRGVPLALIETQVASYLWARAATSSDQLPLNLLAMGALSIAESEPKIWLKYVDKLDELLAREKISERDYTNLRQSLVARSILLAVTDGDVDAFSEDTAEFVLKHALAEHSRELQEELQQRGENLERERQLGADAEKRAADAESRRLAFEKAQHDKFQLTARTDARRIVVVLCTVVGVAALAAAVFSFPWPIDPPPISILPAWASIALGIIGILLSFLSFLVGFTVRGVGRFATKRLAGLLERRYRKKYEPATYQSGGEAEA